ncbi:MAG TPA: toll/interleukin-1 receptor domain-containing protein, partial [Ktedonobacterales bacterium]|nr:toll/interleukin-1 receptor domain-containing protein [Ktedonobacterales bacterium]
MLHVFVSYSQKNATLVSPIIDHLQKQGVDVWMDHERLSPGTPDWEAAIRMGVQRADYIVYMATPEARKSSSVKDELHLAERYQKPVLPMWLRGENWMDAEPLGYSMAQYIDARESS